MLIETAVMKIRSVFSFKAVVGFKNTLKWAYFGGDSWKTVVFEVGIFENWVVEVSSGGFPAMICGIPSRSRVSITCVWR